MQQFGENNSHYVNNSQKGTPGGALKIISFDYICVMQSVSRVL